MTLQQRPFDRHKHELAHTLDRQVIMWLCLATCVSGMKLTKHPSTCDWNGCLCQLAPGIRIHWTVAAIQEDLQNLPARLTPRTHQLHSSGR
eukprot:8787290-Karenia_brevis.AAC.1